LVWDFFGFARVPLKEDRMIGRETAAIGQKQETYRQEHLKPMVAGDNGPRMSAYMKFMDLMSIRPINTHYAQYKIVPQLETVQLYSSSEVKLIAKEIHEWAITEMRTSGKIPHLPDFVDRINKELKPLIKKEIENLQVGQ